MQKIAERTKGGQITLWLNAETLALVQKAEADGIKLNLSGCLRIGVQQTIERMENEYKVHAY